MKYSNNKDLQDLLAMVERFNSFIEYKGKEEERKKIKKKERVKKRKRERKKEIKFKESWLTLITHHTFLKGFLGFQVLRSFFINLPWLQKYFYNQA